MYIYWLVIDENGLATQRRHRLTGCKQGYTSNAASFEATHQVVDEIVKDLLGGYTGKQHLESPRWPDDAA